MLDVFICEDNPIERQRIETIVANKLLIEDWPMQLTLSTADPYVLLSYLEANPQTKGIYFLDIDLDATISGIELGAKIRNLCIDGKIVFITTHSELLALTFKYKVEAMDFIAKDDPELLQKGIQDDLTQAFTHYVSDNKSHQDRVRIDISGQIRFFLLSDILFFETSTDSHKVIMHLLNSSIEFYGKINELQKLSHTFTLVHKSILANVDNIIAIDLKKRLITFKNSETCVGSVRQIKNLRV